MLEIKDAQKRIVDTALPVSGSEVVALDNALGRVLAEDITSAINVPPAANSAMDGYALRAQDAQDNTKPIQVSQRITAGTPGHALLPNTAARIFTGAEIPAGADTVVMQENCSLDSNDNILVLQAPQEGENIRPQGQDISIGLTVLKQGTRLYPQQQGLLASIGHNKIEVRRRVRVAIICTGNELVPPGAPLPPGKIYNSNLTTISALLAAQGCEVSRHHITKDSLAETKDALNSCARDCDLIFSTGGVSVGEEDYVKPAVEALGQLDLWKIKIKPGKPLAFGSVLDTPFMGLPGNPVSAFVTFALFGLPLLKRLQGRAFENPMSFFLPANFSVQRAQKRPEFIRVRIANQTVERFHNQSSGVLTSLCWANALAHIPCDTTVNPGDLVEVFPLDLLLQ